MKCGAGFKNRYSKCNTARWQVRAEVRGKMVCGWCMWPLWPPDIFVPSTEETDYGLWERVRNRMPAARVWS